MKKFRKKPVVIEAEQWLGEVEQKERLLAEGVIINIPSQDGSCLVPTLGGNLPCMVGDWITKDEDGQYSVCSAVEFDSTYEEDDLLVEAEVVNDSKKK